MEQYEHNGVKDNWYNPNPFNSELDKYFSRMEEKEKHRQINPIVPAVNLFNEIIKHLKCECNKDEFEQIYVMELCFACHKVQDFVLELDRNGWIK